MEPKRRNNSRSEGNGRNSNNVVQTKKSAAEITEIIGVGGANVPRYLEETG